MLEIFLMFGVLAGLLVDIIFFVAAVQETTSQIADGLCKRVVIAIIIAAVIHLTWF